MVRKNQTPATTTQVAAATLLAGLAALCAFQSRGILIQISELFPSALPPNPYFVPEHGLLLYVGAAIATAACVVMLLTPGLLFVFAAGGADRAGAFLLKSFGAAFALRVISHAAALALFIERFTYESFLVTELALDVPLAAIAIWRASRRKVLWPFTTSEDRRRLIISMLIPALLVSALIPRFFWQDFTSDGLEALEIGYSLTWHAIPRFPNVLGIGSTGSGMIAMAFPVHWFVLLIGPVEAAARLPLALYLPVLYAALTELIEWSAPRRLRRLEEGVLILALATFAVAMCFNSTYDPYAADIASPGASFETLTVLCMSATLLFTWQRKLPWLLLFAAIGMFARPTELIFLFGLALGTVAAGGEMKNTQLRDVAAGIAVCFVAVLVHDVLWAQHVAGRTAAGLSQLERWRFLTFTDTERFLYAAIPGGLLPFGALVLWSRQDRESRQITVPCALLFVQFYIQAFGAMHHYAPLMILPLVVFWRMAMCARPLLVPTAAVIATASLLISLPRRYEVFRTARHVGCRTAYESSNYEQDWAGHRVTLVSGGPLGELFHGERGAFPERSLLLTPAPIQYYALRCRSDPATAQYVAVNPQSAAPQGMTLVAEDSLMSVFVRDTAEWRRDAGTVPSTEWRSIVYSTPRETLHRGVGARRGNYQVDVTRVPLLWRSFYAARRIRGRKS